MSSLIPSRFFPAPGGDQEIGLGSELCPSLPRWEAKVGALYLVSDPKRACQADKQWNIGNVSSPAG